MDNEKSFVPANKETIATVLNDITEVGQEIDDMLRAIVDTIYGSSPCEDGVCCECASPPGIIDRLKNERGRLRHIHVTVQRIFEAL